MSVNLIVIFFIVLLIGNGTLIWLMFKRGHTNDDKDSGIGLKLILEQMNELTRTVDAKMGETTRQMNESVRSQFGESAKLIREVTQGLTKLDDTNRQVVSFADQLQNLQDILKKPKQRGVLGEY